MFASSKSYLRNHFPAEGQASICGVIVDANDQTGLANDVNQIILGGNLKQSISTPSNVIATINELDNRVSGGDTKATFTDAGTTVQTGNTPYTASTCSYGVTKGKWYAEFKYTAKGAADAAILGVVGKIFS